jgi:hypothetical protein
MRVQFLRAWNGYDDGEVYEVEDTEAGRLVGLGIARAWNKNTDKASGGVADLIGPYTIAASDDGRRFACTTALTVTVTPDSGDCIVFAPASGSLTIARASGATLNGGSTNLTRTMAANRAGVAIIANPAVANDYTVTGA